MNIFYLDSDPKLAAQQICNVHVNKMIIESCQMLSTAHHILNGHKENHQSDPLGSNSR